MGVIGPVGGVNRPDAATREPVTWGLPGLDEEEKPEEGEEDEDERVTFLTV